MSEFAPDRSNLEAWQTNSIDKTEYVARYVDALQRLNWNTMLQRVRAIERNANAEAAFLCWCNLTNSPDGWCHREQLAAIAGSKWNIRIDELDPRPQNHQLELPF